MKSVLLLFLLSFYGLSWSQSTHCVPDVAPWSIELSYPVLIDQNFVGSNFNGVADAGIKYRFSQESLLDFGASINAAVLVNNSNFNQPDLGISYRITSLLLQPKLFAELDFNNFPGFHASAGLGYSFVSFSANGINQGVDVRGTNDTESGINVNTSISFDITNTLFIQVQYDFVRLKNEAQIPDIPFNRNINILKLGAGFRL